MLEGKTEEKSIRNHFGSVYFLSDYTSWVFNAVTVSAAAHVYIYRKIALNELNWRPSDNFHQNDFWTSSLFYIIRIRHTDTHGDTYITYIFRVTKRPACKCASRLHDLLVYTNLSSDGTATQIVVLCGNDCS